MPSNLDAETSRVNISSWIIPAWVAVLCLMISLAGLVDHDLWTPDEHREAAIALSMSRSGNVIVPDLAGEPFVEKPPLYYIVATTAISVAGPLLGNTAALRLTSALWGLGAIGMTWLLARRIMSRDQAAVAALVLATFPGFINVTHWLLVDNALLFFVVASLWAFVEVYECGRGRYLPLAGLFVSGAFLSKGLLGLMIIGLGWMGLVLPCLLGRGSIRLLTMKWFVLHLIALMTFLLPSLAWAFEFRAVVGPELWHEWFWTNHFGRFAGHTEHLGHINGPFYYLDRIILHTLPWTTILAVGLAGFVVRWRAKEYMKQPWILLLAWGFGGLFVLSLSSTKRDIYMLGLLPAFAMMTALLLARFYVVPTGAADSKGLVLPEVPRRWVRIVLSSWTYLTLIVLSIVTLSPLAVSAVLVYAPDAFGEIGEILAAWKASNTIALAAVILLVLLMIRSSMPFLSRWFAVTSAAYLFLLTLLCPIVDGVKSYESAFRDMALQATVGVEGETALWRPDETTLGGFYYYCGLIFPAVSDIDDLVSILNGSHSRFSSVVVSSKNFPPGEHDVPAWSVTGTASMGPRRVLLRITGEKSQ